MLDFVHLEQTLSKDEYRSRLPAVQMRLLQLQRVLREARIGTLLIVEGWDAAGKGRVIRKLTEPLEPRGFDLVWVREPRSHEHPMPWMWRFWKTLPAYGEIAIYDHSWYWRALVEKQEAAESDDQRDAWLDALRDINGFERLLAVDRYCVIKLFLHIDREEQQRRIRRLRNDPDWAWMAEQMDPERHERYDADARLIEEMLQRTESAEAPWRVIAATDHRHAKIRAMETTIERFEQVLRQHRWQIPPPIEGEGIDSCDDGRPLAPAEREKTRGDSAPEPHPPASASPSP